MAKKLANEPAPFLPCPICGFHVRKLVTTSNTDYFWCKADNTLFTGQGKVIGRNPNTVWDEEINYQFY